MRKTIVITGSTRGIGFGLANQFLERGCNVVLNGTSPEGTLKALEALQRFAGHVAGVSADIRTREGISNLCEEAIVRFGRVDIWINNAGVATEMRNVWELDNAVISHVLGVNINGVINGTIIPFLQMQKQGGGKIFNMEGLGSDGYMLDGMTMYGTTKRAISYFTRSFAQEARKTSVQIGTLSPGILISREKYNDERNIFIK